MLIQLLLLLILILIIFFISNKYFKTENKFNEENDTTSLSKKIDDVPNKKSVKENISNEISNLSYQKFDVNGNKYLIKAKKRINFSAKFKLEKGFEQYYKWYKYKVNEIRK